MMIFPRFPASSALGLQTSPSRLSLVPRPMILVFPTSSQAPNHMQLNKVSRHSKGCLAATLR